MMATEIIKDTLESDQNQDSEINETESFISDSSNLRQRKQSALKENELNDENFENVQNQISGYQTDSKHSLRSSKSEIKNIEILDSKQRELDVIDQPFTYEPQQTLTSTVIALDSERKSPVQRKSPVKNDQIFLPELTNKTVRTGNNFTQQPISNSKFNRSTNDGLHKKPKNQTTSRYNTLFKTMSDEEIMNCVNRLSAPSGRGQNFAKFRTIHDDIKDIDLTSVSVRLFSSKIHGRIKSNNQYEGYFKKRIRPADPIEVSERLSAKQGDYITDSCRTIKSSPMKKNDLCVSWAWRGYN